MRVALRQEPLRPAALLEEVSSVAVGATVLFIGTVRDVNDGRAVTGIEYSAYDAMALAEMTRIAEEAHTRFGVERLVLEHRVGMLDLGDVSVALAIAHARRAPALDAARYVIEELKRRVPVWKQEQYADGTREWVNPTSVAVPAGGP